MGKKYDAYVKAVEASNQAKARLAEVNGGATRDAMIEAQTNVEQAYRNEEDTWGQVMQDPNG